MLFSVAFAGLVALASAAPSADTLAVCNYLYNKYPRFIAYDPLGLNALRTVGNASLWTQTNTIYWNNQNSYAFRSACTFFPANAEQVSDAVKQLNKYPSVKFAIKGGGHQPAPGFSSTSDGILLAFEVNLGSATRTPDGKHFIVGPGGRWGDIYKKTGETNQIVVGGRLAHIGVGGFALGGGLSYYSAQYGLTCDNVDQWEVVLADGTAVNATRDQNTELWWSLRGGGNQFGIVTRMWMQAHPEGVNGQVWGGLRAYTPDKRQALFRAITRFIRDYPDAKAAVIPVFQFGLPLNALNAITGPILFMFYDGPIPPPGVFDEFDAITPLFSETGTKRYAEVSQSAGGAAIVGFGNSFREVTYPNLPEDQMVDFFSHYYDATYNQTLIDGIKSGLDVQITGFDPQPVSVRIARASQAQGGNALGLNPDHGDRIWFENNFLWASPLCQDRCPQFSKQISDTLLAYQKATYGGVAPTNYKSGDLQRVSYNPLFMNDVAPDQDPYSSYPPENLARLKAAKQKYDPTGFFTNRQGGFKLPA
ncbi:Putative berberine/berberine, FAD-binding domain, PCMH-type, FAD-binding, type PCMH, subdomain 2 [Septoria linicola]|uniref:Berberine/berberine, FAD-binding domain, PCMH-type, FAD-binding, type PCMH, subdomain 2 n=1 Tax=Septoria linicola TaxID=215465 RepID=A0A9Q9B608_9PEZI|nr:Putative berberine/berberine, FAD-binding domain, PCMH-type, FAD-binding, type PCMH, subdomain 2 [Septoria linicola]